MSVAASAGQKAEGDITPAASAADGVHRVSPVLAMGAMLLLALNLRVGISSVGPVLPQVNQSGITCAVHKIGFRNGAGDFESILQFGPGGGPGIGMEGPMFLVAGARTVAADTTCPWQVSVAPWIGLRGGGTRGFGTGR